MSKTTEATRGTARPLSLWFGALLLAFCPAGPLIADDDAPPVPDGSLSLLGATVAPGSSRRLSWASGDLFEGLSAATPVLVVNGRHAGPTLCLTAAVHGDELNGIEIVRQVVHGLDPDELAGAVVGVPVVNLHGFRRASRYLPDRRDLNRYFPGNPGGSSASRIAHAFFSEVVTHCDALVDLHTGSNHRTNLPQLRADLREPGVIQLTRGFDSMVVVHSRPASGTLRRAAVDAGIPALTMEAGEPLRLQPEEVEQGVAGISALMNALGMIKRSPMQPWSAPVYYDSRWVRTDHGGMLLAHVQPGDEVSSGEVLGTVTDPVTNRVTRIVAPEDGRVIGMALNQVVMPGFAAFHLGLASSPPDAVEAAYPLLGPQRRILDHGELALGAPLPGAGDAVAETDESRRSGSQSPDDAGRLLPVARLLDEIRPRYTATLYDEAFEPPTLTDAAATLALVRPQGRPIARLTERPLPWAEPSWTALRLVTTRHAVSTPLGPRWHELEAAVRDARDGRGATEEASRRIRLATGDRAPEGDTPPRDDEEDEEED